MSLKKKYTWKDFLKDNPEHKAKKTKRTSKEAQKAFEAAFKQHAKDHLKARLEKIDKEKKRAEEKRSSLNKALKGIKTKPAANNVKAKIGWMNSYLNRLAKISERTKTLQKSL